MDAHLRDINRTIKYFYELIKWKGGTLTIRSLTFHLLNSQYTVDMRQIVGNTEGGLLQFLSEHPTFFVINGSIISITDTYPTFIKKPKEFQEANDTRAQAAIRHICNKLTKCGDSMPIARLYSELTDVTQPVRNVLGTNIQQLHNFLVSHPHCFLISNDKSVSLKNCKTESCEKNVEYKWLETSFLTLSLKNPSFNRDDLLHNTFIIDTTEECQIFIDHFLKTAKNNQCSINNKNGWPFTSDRVAVGFDCEGTNYNNKRHITLIKIGTRAQILFMFDVMTCPGIMDAGLKQLLLSYDVVKVIHDVRRYARALHEQFKVIPQNVYDLQVGNYIELSQKYSNTSNTLTYVSVNSLCGIHNCRQNPYNLMYDKLKSTGEVWTKRPFTQQMILLATAYISNLLPIYFSNISLIRPENHNLLLEMCKKQVFSQVNPLLVDQKSEIKTDVFNNKKYSNSNVVVIKPLLVENKKETGDALVKIRKAEFVNDKCARNVGVINPVLQEGKRISGSVKANLEEAAKRQRLDAQECTTNDFESISDDSSMDSDNQKHVIKDSKVIMDKCIIKDYEVLLEQSIADCNNQTKDFDVLLDSVTNPNTQNCAITKDFEIIIDGLDDFNNQEAIIKDFEIVGDHSFTNSVHRKYLVMDPFSGSFCACSECHPPKHKQ